MDWWDLFTKELLSADWAAGLLQATIGAGIAFAGAFILVRLQLRHDLKLVTAQNARSTVETLGRMLVALRSDLDEFGRIKLSRHLIKRAESPPGVVDIRKAMSLAGASIREVDDPSGWLVRDLEIIWRICAEEAARFSGLPGSSKIDKKVMGFSIGAATILTMDWTLARIYEIGEALVNWDGMTQLPGREFLSSPNWEHSPGTAYPEFAAWRANIATTYTAHLERLLDLYRDGTIELPGR